MGSFGEFRFNLQLFAGDKTEEPTEKRKRDSRKKGQVAKSPELGAAAAVLGLFMGYQFWGGSAVREMHTLARSWFLDPPIGSLTVDGLGGLSYTVVLTYLKACLPMFILSMGIGILANAAQVGFLLVPEALKPKLERLNPIEGFKRVFSKRAVVQFAKSVLKFSLLGLVAYLQIRRDFAQLLSTSYLSVGQASQVVGSWILGLGMRLGWLMLALAAADYGYQWWEHRQNLRMSKQEVKEERKEQEGDPLTHSRIRRKQRELAGRRMMQAVPGADVVVTNPTHLAIALKYDPETMGAPIVVAKGKDLLAERIKKIARTHGVAIVENRPLAQALYKAAQIGQEVPEKLYQAVAEVLAFVYRLREEMR